MENKNKSNMPCSAHFTRLCYTVIAKWRANKQELRDLKKGVTPETPAPGKNADSLAAERVQGFSDNIIIGICRRVLPGGKYRYGFHSG